MYLFPEQLSVVYNLSGKLHVVFFFLSGRKKKVHFILSGIVLLIRYLFLTVIKLPNISLSLLTKVKNIKRWEELKKVLKKNKNKYKAIPSPPLLF